MITTKNLTKRQAIALADGIARGQSLLTISGAVGIDRSSLRKRLADPGAIAELARRIGSPGVLDGEALESLFDDRAHFGERDAAIKLRLAFADAVRATYRKWFDTRDREVEKARAEERRRRDAAKREADAENARREAEYAKMLECLRADFWNLQTLVEMRHREWESGTPSELKRGLSTPDARRQYRCVRGLRWSCVGFGCYYDPTWSACRCRMQYALDEAAGDRLTAFGEIASNPQFSAAWCEIEAEDDGGEHNRNPFARRDPGLPTTEDDAKALLKHVERGGSFSDWKRQPPGDTRKPRKAKGK